MIDSHVHLDDSRFDPDRPAVIERARSAGVSEFVVPATTKTSWPTIAGLARSVRGLHPAYGLHPWFMPQHRPSDIEALDRWLDEHPAVAVGECGLDFHSSGADQAAQLELFRAQIALAVDHRLPLIVHARKALDLVLRELRRYRGRVEGVLHGYSGSVQQARQAVDLGFRIGIAAIIGYPRAQRLRRVARELDVSALLIESDAPDQAGPMHRGERNEPAFLPEQLEVLAGLRACAPDALARQLDDNCRTLFGLEASDDD